MDKWTYGIEAEMVDFNNQNPITGKYYISSEVCSINSDGMKIFYIIQVSY